MNYDAIIIGAGLFGQIINKKLISQGRRTLMLDSNRDMAGSKPAACLMKPSWIAGLGKQIIEPALRTLGDLYDIQDIKFTLRPMKTGGKIGSSTVHWINPAHILSGETTAGNVVDIVEDCVSWSDLMAGGIHVDRSPLIIVCAGIWTEKLLPQYKQTAQRGVAFLHPDRKLLEEPFIFPYRPYRQLVGFDRGDQTWISDGTAIKAENWTTDREWDAYERCTKAAGIHQHSIMSALHGLRPYSKGSKPCLLEEARPGVWVASGGAKNGTLAAGYCAYEIARKTS